MIFWACDCANVPSIIPPKIDEPSNSVCGTYFLYLSTHPCDGLTGVYVR